MGKGSRGNISIFSTQPIRIYKYTPFKRYFKKDGMGMLMQMSTFWVFFVPRLGNGEILGPPFFFNRGTSLTVKRRDQNAS